MFDKLRSGISSVFDKFFSSQITEDQFNAAMRELRVVLLEADIALPAVKSIITNLKEKAVGQDVWKSFTAKKMVMKLLHDELLALVDHPDKELNLHNKRNVILMAGLQGSGKTSTTAKLAKHLKQQHSNKRILLASLDIYRPAAQLQLEILAKEIQVDSLPIVPNQAPQDICKRALAENHDFIILDTAGRITVDTAMMQELVEIYKMAKPAEALLVVDALMGQSAIEVAEQFKKSIDITGVIMTRIDSNAKLGSAISVKVALDKPIKFLSKGEKVDDFEKFQPARIVSRIMDMGDILSLAEKMRSSINEKDSEKLTRRLQEGKFSLEDYMMMVGSVKKFGGIASMLSFLPGANKLGAMSQNSNMNDETLAKQMVILQSMTKKERLHPKILNGSRKLRIAKGSGTKVEDINAFMKQYFDMEHMVKQLFGGNPRMMAMLKKFM